MSSDKGMYPKYLKGTIGEKDSDGIYTTANNDYIFHSKYNRQEVK